MRQLASRLGALVVALAISVGLMTVAAPSASAHTSAWKQTPYYNMWCYTYHVQSGTWFWATHRGYAVCDTKNYGGPSAGDPAFAIWRMQVKCRSGALYTSGWTFNANYSPNAKVLVPAPQECDSDGIYWIAVLEASLEYFWEGTGPYNRITYYH